MLNNVDAKGADARCRVESSDLSALHSVASEVTSPGNADIWAWLKSLCGVLTRKSDIAPRPTHFNVKLPLISGHLQWTDTFAWSRGCPFMTGTTVYGLG